MAAAAAGAEADKEQEEAAALRRAAAAACEQAWVDHEAVVEEQKQEKLETEAAKEAEGRKRTASGHYLADVAAAQGTHKRRLGRKARKLARKRAAKEMEQQRAVLEVQEAQVVAQEATLTRKEQQGQTCLDPVEQAQARPTIFSTFYKILLLKTSMCRSSRLCTHGV